MTAPLLGQRTITRRRWSGGTWGSDGQWTATGPTDTEILASVQEASARELEQLDEGERASDPIKLYTVADVQTTDQHPSDAGGQDTQADHLLVDGAWYKVVKVGPRHPLLPHVKVIAIRVRETG